MQAQKPGRRCEREQNIRLHMTDNIGSLLEDSVLVTEFENNAHNGFYA
jgi:hypothetical protein